MLIAASWYYADGITDVKYGCLQMLDWLVSTHPKKGGKNTDKFCP